MSTTAANRAEFGRRLGELRRKSGATQRDVAEAMARHGHKVAPQTVSGYERGTFAPDPPQARVLDSVLGGEGQLLDALGYSAEDEQLTDRVAELEETVAQYKAKFAQIEARLDQQQEEDPDIQALQKLAQQKNLPDWQRAEFRKLIQILREALDPPAAAEGA